MSPERSAEIQDLIGHMMPTDRWPGVVPVRAALEDMSAELARVVALGPPPLTPLDFSDLGAAWADGYQAGLDYAEIPNVVVPTNPYIQQAAASGQSSDLANTSL